MLAALISKRKFKEKLEMNFKLQLNRWTLVSIVTPILLIVCSSLVLSLLGTNYESSGYLGITMGVAVISTVIGCTAEEIGWRGYLLPMLNKSKSIFLSSFLTGIFWAVWHMFKIISVGILGYFLFMPSIILFVFELIVLSGIWIKEKSHSDFFKATTFNKNSTTVKASSPPR